MTLILDCSPSGVNTVMIAFPFFFAVTLPLDVTVATFFLEDFQISFFLEQLLKIAPNWIDFFLFNEMQMSMLGALDGSNVAI